MSDMPVMGQQEISFDEKEQEKRVNLQKKFTKTLFNYYSPFFSTVNTTRKKQAKKLIGSIDDIPRETGSFYQELFQCITVMQNEILISDKNTRWNKKGYSRLFDITLTLQTQLLSHWLQDAQSQASIGEASKQIEDNLDTITQLFAERLKACPQDMLLSLKGLGIVREPNQAGQYPTLTDEQRKLLQANKESLINYVGDSRKTIPKQLLYLLDTIKIYAEAATLHTPSSLTCTC